MTVLLSHRTLLTLCVLMGVACATAGVGLSPERLRELAESCAEEEDEDACLEACEGGHLFSCYDIGLHRYEGGESLEEQHEGALLFEYACRQGMGKACLEVGRILRLGELTESQPAAAWTYVSLACDLGESEGCYEVALALKSGDGIAEDLAASKMLLERLCQQGHEDSCAAIDAWVFEGESTREEGLESAEPLETLDKPDGEVQDDVDESMGDTQ